MKFSKLFKTKQSILMAFIVSLAMGFTQVSLANEPFIKKIRIKGNTLIDPQSLKQHFDLGNGLKMDPFLMDLAASELRSVYRFHGHPDIDSHALLKSHKGTLTLKVDEQREYRYGAARAELAVYNLDWNFNMKTTEKQKEEAIRKLVKGDKKIKLNEEVVTSYLVKSQRVRIEGIEAERKKAMREKIATAIIAFKERNLALEKEQAQKMIEMRARVKASSEKKEMGEEKPKLMEYGEITPFERSAF